ncbi:MAG: DUF2993 domain-containing protein [Synechococcales cyanobacterium T60_A2020_003]|nr:DUF2993 domain-containing protein [Synechococcales cyanobacterium T60_A2020_003]
MTLLAPVGVISESLVEDALRDRLSSAESLQVRIDNVPTHQLLEGRVDRVRIAGRGLYPLPDARIALLDIETDPIDVQMDQVRQGHLRLEEPLQMAMHVVITEDDLQTALQSEAVIEQLQDWSEDIFGEGIDGYDLVDPKVQFLGDRRLQVKVQLQGRSPDVDPIAISAAVTIDALGAQVQLLDPQITIDNEPLPDELVNPVVQGLNQQLDLRSLENEGITARLLDWELTPDTLSIVAFVKAEPKALR